MINNIPIETVGGVIQTLTSEAIGIFHKYSFTGRGTSIHSSPKLEHYGNKVDYRSSIIRGETLKIKSEFNTENNVSENSEKEFQNNQNYRNRKNDQNYNKKDIVAPVGVLKQFTMSFCEFCSKFGIPYLNLCSTEKIYF